MTALWMEPFDEAAQIYRRQREELAMSELKFALEGVHSSNWREGTDDCEA